MRSLFPNARLIGKESENLGRDWFELSQAIDASLDQTQYELAQEWVYLKFAQIPQIDSLDIPVKVYRSVIGPRKDLASGLELLDVEQFQGERFPIMARDWEQIYAEVHQIWENLTRQGRNSGQGCWFLVQRNYDSGLDLRLEVMFHV